MNGIHQEAWWMEFRDRGWPQMTQPRSEIHRNHTLYAFGDFWVDFSSKNRSWSARKRLPACIWWLLHWFFIQKSILKCTKTFTTVCSVTFGWILLQLDLKSARRTDKSIGLLCKLRPAGAMKNRTLAGQEEETQGAVAGSFEFAVRHFWRRGRPFSLWYYLIPGVVLQSVLI